MCRPANCKVCGKTTWAGCGQHVDQVMANVPRGERCPGHRDAEKSAAGNGSAFARFFGRS
ncbi:hypothetical protein [Knoellia aerolata]|uniref:Uncharacterized protein n=1 Tax=Knoellia aerolata DSM 18566 TaxID=1385519 RepID=A0A0A0JZ96_9MICO|nr:hypothetical protein [Knoellia aerolata]KGN42014.1 hypothetical protein N801_03065 [Knoellia aerolata DSM 18566]